MPQENIPLEVLCKIVSTVYSLRDLRNTATAHSKLLSAVQWRLGQDKIEVQIMLTHVYLSRHVFVESRYIDLGMRMEFQEDKIFSTFASLWDLLYPTVRDIYIYLPAQENHTKEDAIWMADTIFSIVSSNHTIDKVVIQSNSEGVSVSYAQLDPLIRFTLFNLFKNTGISTIILYNFKNIEGWGRHLNRRGIQTRRR